MSRLVVALIALFGGWLVAPGGAGASSVHVLPIEGPIGPATSDLVERSIADAVEQRAELVILRLDTPGGLDTSMRVIVQAIIDSPLPIVAYVAPAGARAASAGTFILYASHLAAMAPGTNLGAATPVPIMGGDAADAKRPADEPNTDTGNPEAPPSTSKSASDSKAVEDAAAYLRALAEMRGRDPGFAEAAVRRATSLTYREALDAGAIEFIAADVDELLAMIDGRRVELAQGVEVIASKGATIEIVEPDWRYRLLAIITNPNVAAILMLVGVYGIIFEFYSPGLVGPGLVGAICLLLGLYAFQVLPVSYAGLALLGLGITLVVAEAFLPAFGVLGISGVAAFIAGSILLMDTDVPGFGISPYVLGSLVVSISGVFVVTLSLAMRSQNRPVATGAEAIASGHAEIVSWHAAGGGCGEGRVRLDGELWQAEGPDGLVPGARVAVRSRAGLTLTVEPEKPRE
jgi:membrane-bound serine protease (ClpP class)